jgi:hypothetical protein
MRYRRRLFAIAIAILVASAHRLPAPIAEETPSPPSAAEKPKAVAGKQKSVESPKSNSARRFDGTWRGTRVDKTAGYVYDYSYMLIIRDGKPADLISEVTATLPPLGWWSFLPDAYRHLSPLYVKATNHSDHVVADGSDLIIRWRGGQLVDWEPKTLPREYAEQLAAPQTSNKPNVFTLNGDELVAAGGTIYHRVK